MANSRKVLSKTGVMNWQKENLENMCTPGPNARQRKIRNIGYTRRDKTCQKSTKLDAHPAPKNGVLKAAP